MALQCRRGRRDGGVGEGESKWSGLSSGIFKSTDSWRRSSENYYFRLFKLREDKKGGRDGKDAEETQRALRASHDVLDFFFSNFVCGFLLEKSKRRKKSICFFFFVCFFPAEQREPHPRLLSLPLLTGERRAMDSSSGGFWGFVDLQMGTL